MRNHLFVGSPAPIEYVRFSERRALWQQFGMRMDEAPRHEVVEALSFIRLEQHYRKPKD